MRSDEQPPFEAPWQAQAFAMTVHLNECGVFTWSEWADALATERKRSADAGIADAPDQYYLDWLRALEGLLTRRGEAAAEDLTAFREAWVAAYETTPHGHPVHLEKGFEALGKPAPEGARR
ncbi:nitrile hydratase accessory protein [Aquisalimonas sp.]|uniref:nitrile hydratase accessory protein n=1 Tax=unclassified Aquisalimonas TaxID=2644645 RepID=UPI0025B980B4|nr:nitrile hydratase accessory protein [Aquisalimonas sp.]